MGDRLAQLGVPMVLRLPINDDTGALITGMAFDGSDGFTLTVMKDNDPTPTSFTQVLPATDFEDVTTLGTYEAPSTAAQCRMKQATAGLLEIHLHQSFFSGVIDTKRLDITWTGMATMTDGRYSVEFDVDHSGRGGISQVGVDGIQVANNDIILSSEDGVVTGNGRGAYFRITANEGPDYQVQILVPGDRFVGGDTITFDGALLGGVSVTNDLVLTVADLVHPIGSTRYLTWFELAGMYPGLVSISSRIPSALTSGGNMKAGVQGFLDTVFTEGASGRIANAFKQFFNIASPASTMDVPAATWTAAVWDKLTSAITTTGSIGKLLKDTLTGDAYARLGAPAGASVSADVAAVKTDTGNLVTRITSALFSGITSMANWLGALAGKQSADSTAITEIRARGAGSGTFDATTDSQEAIRDNMGTAQTGDSFARLGAPAGANVSADVAAVKTDTGNLVTRITSTLFSGITAMKNWLGAIAGKQAGDSTAITEIRAAGAGSGTFDPTTDSLEAVKDSALAAGAAMTLTSGERTALLNAFWPGVTKITGTVVADGGNSATTFKTDLAVNCKNAFLTITSGALAGQTARITSQSTVFVTTSGFTGTPANGVTFLIVNV